MRTEVVEYMRSIRDSTLSQFSEEAKIHEKYCEYNASYWSTRDDVEVSEIESLTILQLTRYSEMWYGNISSRK